MGLNGMELGKDRIGKAGRGEVRYEDGRNDEDCRDDGDGYTSSSSGGGGGKIGDMIESTKSSSMGYDYMKLLMCYI